MSESQPPIKTGLLEFLKKSVGSQFVIPVYQRNYTWTANKEVKQYFDDLESVLKGKYNKHFLGILIYLDTPLTYSTREFSVIDGQQRLTTTFLVLYAIKELMIEKGNNEEASRLDNQFLTNQYVEDKLKFKLKPLVSDDEVYQQIVNDQFSLITNKNSNIYKNYVWIKDKLDDYLKKYTFNDILMALDKLYVVCVPVIKEDSPQRIFESINSTGAKLVSSDLIRNYVLMDIESESQESLYNKYWRVIETYLNNDSKKIELFFRMFLACKTKTLSNLATVYSDFKNWYSNELQTKTVEEILKTIVSYARYYNSIYLKKIDEVDSSLRGAIKEFRDILSDMPAPLLMEVYSLYDSVDEFGNKNVTAFQFIEIINIVNTYLIRRAICGLDTSDITRLFPVVLKDVMNDCGSDYSKIVDYVKKELINKQRGKSSAMPDDETLSTYLEYANVYNLRFTLRIIFNKLETFGNPAPVDLSKLSIEHLMPQTPTKEWLDALKVDEATYERNLHRLGNLTLATRPDNSKMSNKPFEYKKQILSDTAHLVMNKEILELPKWDVDEIDTRNKKLIEKIKEIYPNYSASDSVIEKHEIYIKSDGIVCFGYLYEDDGSVEIQAGSEMVRYDTSQNYEEWEKELYDDLLEKGIIVEKENTAEFLKPYMIYATRSNTTTLSATASFVLTGSKNGWDYWLDESGKPLNSNAELKKKMTGK